MAFTTSKGATAQRPGTAQPQHAGGLADRSVVAFLLLLALAALVAVAWKEADSLRNARQELRSELQLQSLTLAAAFETAFESTGQTLDGLAYRLEYSAGSPAPEHDLDLDLRNRALRAPALEDLRYYRADGQLAERSSLLPLASETLPAWAQQDIRQGRPTGVGKEGMGMAFFRQARGKDGRPLGTLYATLSDLYFQAVLAQSLVSGATASCLVDADGVVMMDVGYPGASCQPAAVRQRIARVDAQYGAYGSRLQDVDQQLLVLQQLRNHPLRVVQMRSYEPALQRWQAGAVYSLAAALLIVLAALLFIRYLKSMAAVRQRAEDKLRQAQARLQASHDLLDRLSQHVPGVIYQYRLYPDGRATFPYASRGLSDIFGVAAAHFERDAAAVFACVLEEDAKGLAASTQHSAQTLSTWQHEFRIHHSSGEVRWLAGLAKPMRLDDGSILWHGFVRDVTDRKQLEQAVYEHDRDLNTILESSGVGIVFIREQRQIWANARMAEVLGYRLAEILGQSLQMYFPVAADFVALEASHAAAIARGERCVAELQLRHKQGPLVWVRLSGKAVDAQQPQAGSIWVLEDISDQKRLEAKLQLAASVFTAAREGILITDAAGAIVDVNATFTQITGYSRDEVLGQNPRLLQSGLQTPAFYQQLWQELQAHGHWNGEVWNRRKSGEVYAQTMGISTVRDAAGRTQNYVALFSDITLLKAHQLQLEHIAHYDALTALPNRVLLADRLRQAIAQCQRRARCLAVVFLDLDGFKAVNDTHGHATGDELLVALAQRMQAALRQGDTLARIGGDEFVAVLADLEQAGDCEPILLRLLQTAAEPVHLRQLELQVSASMGVALYPQDGAEEGLLMRQADQAMYRAKQAGKNRFLLFDGSLHSGMAQRSEDPQAAPQAMLPERLAPAASSR